MSWKEAKDPENRSKKDCCCGCHSAHDHKKSKTHHSTAQRIAIRKSRRMNEKMWR